MKDHIEKFIQDNREEFDFLTPDAHIWNRIERQLDHKKERRTIFMWSSRIAAIMVTVLVVGIVIGLSLGHKNSSDINYALSPELKSLQETENYYQQQVSVKLNEVKSIQPESNIENDLKQLDEIYEELKSELIKSNYSNSEIMINAMIKNHKTKVEILESILEKQNKNKNEIDKISI
ncbi:MAG: hypothetical protein IPM42_14390 [Saprospiraceae bacterium]|nr:hypothetical protein [Saprospiraceae bacterium]